MQTDVGTSTLSGVTHSNSNIHTHTHTTHTYTLIQEMSFKQGCTTYSFVGDTVILESV